MDGSMVFARLHQRTSSNTCFLGPTSQKASRLVQPFLHSSRHSIVSMPAYVLSPKNCAFAMGDLDTI